MLLGARHLYSSHMVVVEMIEMGGLTHLQAPASVRGLCTCVFTGFVYLGIVLAYFTNYGCEVNMGDNTHKRWVCTASSHRTHSTKLTSPARAD